MTSARSSATGLRRRGELGREVAGAGLRWRGEVGARRHAASELWRHRRRWQGLGLGHEESKNEGTAEINRSPDVTEKETEKRVLKPREIH